MKTSPILFALGMAALSVWTSCESEDAADVNQQRIQTDYSISYDTSKDQTLVWAQFRFGSTFLKLNHPSSVTFENDKLREEEILGVVQYRKQYSGEVTSGTFRYVNSEEDDYQNTLSLPSVIDLPATLPEFSMADGVTIKWEGDPVQNGETITLYLSNDNHLFMETTTVVGATMIQVEAGKIQSELLGECQVKIGRVFRTSLDEAPEEGGFGRSEFTSEAVGVVVAP